MTADDFRADENRVNELRAALANPVLVDALLVIHDGKTIEDAPEGSDPLASVRKLSNLAGRAEVIRELYQLATPLVKPETPRAPDFGVTDPPPPGWTPETI